LTRTSAGTGVSVIGSAACDIKPASDADIDPLSFFAYLDSTSPDIDEARKRITTEALQPSRVLYEIFHLERRNTSRASVITWHDFSPCTRNSNITFLLEYALVSLHPTEPFNTDVKLSLIGLPDNNAFVMSRGNWQEGRDVLQPLAPMHASLEISLRFTVFASSMTVHFYVLTGSMSVRVNGKARSEDNIHTDDTVLEDTVISLNLSTEWAGTPHVVHLAFEGEISFKSITYKPTFASMEELNAKIMEWNSTFLGISPARTLVAREANPFPGPQNLVGPLIGGIIGLCTLVGVIILALYVHRRRNRLCQQSILDTILSDPNNSQELSVQAAADPEQPVPFSIMYYRALDSSAALQPSLDWRHFHANTTSPNWKSYDDSISPDAAVPHPAPPTGTTVVSYLFEPALPEQDNTTRWKLHLRIFLVENDHARPGLSDQPASRERGKEMVVQKKEGVALRPYASPPTPGRTEQNGYTIVHRMRIFQS
ncbi:hypothetical protein BDV98DRAFT_587326, partial [Pterulicium gracile]